MTENEYNETFEMRMEKEHQQTLARMQQFSLFLDEMFKMPNTQQQNRKEL
jgi:hypothetical protein